MTQGGQTVLLPFARFFYGGFMNRIISLSIEDMYIKYTGEAFGATGSHNAVTLRMTFGPVWDGTAKTAYFTDALGSASVAMVLGLDTLTEDGAYEVDVPSEALKIAGVATVTIKGVLVSGETTTKAITTAAGHFRVLDSELPESVGNAGTITASDKEQLQAEIAGMETLFTTGKAAAEEAAANAKASEEAAQASAAAASESASAAADSVKQAANQIPLAREEVKKAEDAADRAEAAWAGLQKTDVYAITVPYTEKAAAVKEQVEDHFHIRFEIPEGKPGRNGAVVTAAGMFAFQVNDEGHLILTYTGDTAPNFSINAAGHLILTL